MESDAWRDAHAPEPVCVGVDDELGGEGGGEGGVDVVQPGPCVRRRAVLVGHFFDDLGLDGVEGEVLPIQCCGEQEVR